MQEVTRAALRIVFVCEVPGVPKYALISIEEREETQNTKLSRPLPST
jgi:hypothetical protein